MPRLDIIYLLMSNRREVGRIFDSIYLHRDNIVPVMCLAETARLHYTVLCVLNKIILYAVSDDVKCPSFISLHFTRPDWK